MDYLQIGQIIKYPQQRDAIHVAIAPIEAVHEFNPGQLVKVQDNKAYSTISKKNATGIVDPFLTIKVKPGEQFWLFLFPGSIHSLRHDWSHPSFTTTKQVPNLDAKEWLNNFAINNDTDLEDILRAAEEGWTSNGSGITVPEEFWIFYKLYTGKDGVKTDYFSCSC